MNREQTDTERFNEAFKASENLRAMVDQLPLDNPDNKVIALFVEVAFNIHDLKATHDLIGLDNFVAICNCTSIEQLPDLILRSGLFDMKMDGISKIEKMVRAWQRNYTQQEGLNSASFVQDCVIAITQQLDLLGDSGMKVDTKEREKLTKKYGVEV